MLWNCLYMKNVWGPRQGDFQPCLGGNMTVSVHFRQQSRLKTQIQDGCRRPFSIIMSTERGQNWSGIYDWYGLFWYFFRFGGNLFFFFLFCTKTLWSILTLDCCANESFCFHLLNKWLCCYFRCICYIKHTIKWFIKLQIDHSYVW